MNDMLVREVSNGQWFVLSAVMTIFFVTYAIMRPVSIGPYKPAFIDRHFTVSTQLALALTTYMTGSSLRAGYIWFLLHCQNISNDCGHLQSIAWLMLVASAFAVVGGLWAIRTLSPTQWRPWSWMGAGTISLAIPFFYYTTGQWAAFLEPTGQVVLGHHDMGLVVLSVAVACLTSYVGLDLGERARQTQDIGWLVAAAIVLGGGIWSMHFVAMLAFTLPGVDVTYDLALTLLSFAVPVVVTAIGLIVVRHDSRKASIVAAGVLIGVGVAAMHYVGMAAMQMSVDLSYDALFFSVSVMIAIGVSVVAVWLAFRTTSPVHKVLAALIQGVAIAGMHYVAMVAAIFHMPTHGHVPSEAIISNIHLALAVAAITFGVLIIALAASVYDRSMAHPK